METSYLYIAKRYILKLSLQAWRWAIGNRGYIWQLLRPELAIFGGGYLLWCLDAAKKNPARFYGVLAPERLSNVPHQAILATGTVLIGLGIYRLLMLILGADFGITPPAVADREDARLASPAPDAQGFSLGKFLASQHLAAILFASAAAASTVALPLLTKQPDDPPPPKQCPTSSGAVCGNNPEVVFADPADIDRRLEKLEQDNRQFEIKLAELDGRRQQAGTDEPDRDALRKALFSLEDLAKSFGEHANKDAENLGAAMKEQSNRAGAFDNLNLALSTSLSKAADVYLPLIKSDAEERRRADALQRLSLFIELLRDRRSAITRMHDYFVGYRPRCIDALAQKVREADDPTEEVKLVQAHLVDELEHCEAKARQQTATND